LPIRIKVACDGKWMLGTTEILFHIFSLFTDKDKRTKIGFRWLEITSLVSHFTGASNDLHSDLFSWVTENCE